MHFNTVFARRQDFSWFMKNFRVTVTPSLFCVTMRWILAPCQGAWGGNDDLPRVTLRSTLGCDMARRWRACLFTRSVAWRIWLTVGLAPLPNSHAQKGVFGSGACPLPNSPSGEPYVPMAHRRATKFPFYKMGFNIKMFIVEVLKPQGSKI